MLPNCTKLPVCKFKRICSDDLPIMTEDVLKDLSRDQKYLYQICHAIQSGSCSSSLAMSPTGNRSHSRWLTTANAVLRYYISVERPTKELVLLAKFIIQVYAPLWFRIKSNSNITDGPKHVFFMIKLIRENMPKKLWNLLFDVIQNNAYFAHPENVLLSMLVDNDESIRERATETISRIKENAPLTQRKFTKPIINFKANSYHEMIDIDAVTNLPPLLKDCNESPESIVQAMTEGIPCHTQAVERIIKTVSEASHVVYGGENRNGRVIACLESRSVLPRARTKADYSEYAT